MTSDLFQITRRPHNPLMCTDLIRSRFSLSKEPDSPEGLLLDLLVICAKCAMDSSYDTMGGARRGQQHNKMPLTHHNNCTFERLCKLAWVASFLESLATSCVSENHQLYTATIVHSVEYAQCALLQPPLPPFPFRRSMPSSIEVVVCRHRLTRPPAFHPGGGMIYGKQRCWSGTPNTHDHRTYLLPPPATSHHVEK